VELVCGRMAAVAERLGCRRKSGGNDATTYLIPSHDAAVDFIAEVTGLAEPWWTVTATAGPSTPAAAPGEPAPNAPG
jgi:hypothetical protein